MSEPKFKIGDKVVSFGRNYTVVDVRYSYDLVDKDGSFTPCVLGGSLKMLEQPSSFWVNRDSLGSLWCGPVGGFSSDQTCPRIYWSKEEAERHAEVLSHNYFRTVETLEFTRKT